MLFSAIEWPLLGNCKIDDLVTGNKTGWRKLCVDAPLANPPQNELPHQ